MILLLGSLTFYFVSTLHNPLHFTLLIFSIILDFYTGLCIENSTKHKKVFLITSVLLHLTILCIFKYSNFVLGELKNTFDFEILKSEIVLPIGISFYTFQSISYIADIYTKKSKAEKSLLNYAVYISMFPQLIAGPIVTYSDIKEDLKVKHITKQKVLKAMGIFVFGLGLKVLLANPLGKLWSQVLAIGFESITTPLAWLALFAYSFQLYFDFFAYSLMAVGLGGMLGFKIPKNFNHPYTSLTMSEFWRRWHITLGAWFKNYVYIPLGGNKKGKAKMVLNLLTVWVLTGIWHGAGYNFIIWGLIIFITITGEKLLYGNALKKHPIIAKVRMIILVPITWAVFAVNNTAQLKILFSKLLVFFSNNDTVIFKNDYLKYLGEYWIFFIAAILLSFKFPYRLLNKLKNKKVIFILISTIFIASLYCMYKGYDDPFLYFRF